MRLTQLLQLAGVTLFLVPLGARADFVLNGPDITATPASTGEFEVSYEVPTGATASTLTAFNITLDATADLTATGLTFTAVTDATIDPYVFAGSTTFSGSATPGANPSASFSDSGSQTVDAGQTFGLAEISYTVAADAVAGTYTVDPSGTVTQTGSLMSVLVPSAIVIVPEPGVGRIMVLGLAVAGALGIARRRLPSLPI